ncbi:MAG: T9SS type A sorting domain-containing protein [Ignavibacteriales bacterium]|nr:MAG: T9SS type A sorting domain-containing protein [Ignavibacteriales bacterium]
MFFIFLSFFLLSLIAFTTPEKITTSEEGCTIGVVSGRATPDGRPLLWKVRDNSDMPNNNLVYNSSCAYKFIAVVNNGDSVVWMGVNEKGLAIVNSTAYDLPGTNSGFSNGSLMYYALGYLSSVEQFENLLERTNQTGRKTRANFALIDASGAAAIFETAGTQFKKFDANDLTQSPDGFVIRTNFAFSGGGTTGTDRYKRTVELISSLKKDNALSYESIIKNHFRDFSNELSVPVELPYKNRWYNSKPFGYINSNFSVCRKISLSASVFHGVKSNEPPALTTMWTSLGNPSSTVALPYWVVGETPELTRGELISPMYKTSEAIKSYLYDDAVNKSYFDSYKLVDESGYGITGEIKRFEESILRTTDNELNNIRERHHSINRLLRIENELCASGYRFLQEIKSTLNNLISLEVLNEKSWETIRDISFEDDNIIQLVSAGRNGMIDDPVINGGDVAVGMPGNDDYLIGENHTLGENDDDHGRFYLRKMLWKNIHGLPSAGEKIYLRIFNSNDLNSALYYGNSGLYEITSSSKQKFNPEILEVIKLRPKETTPEIAGSEYLQFSLSDNFPNPFNPSTVINYSLPVDSDVRLEVFNLIGESVTVLENTFKNSGSYSVSFNASGYSSGIYYYRLTAGTYTAIKKMLLIK